MEIKGIFEGALTVGKAEVGTDGDPDPEKLWDVEDTVIRLNIEPENVATIVLELSNDQIIAEEMDGSELKETDTSKSIYIVGKGDGQQDTVITAKLKDTNSTCATMNVFVHKPKQISRSESADLDPPAGKVGDGQLHKYWVQDVQGREFSVLGYTVWEHLQVEENVEPGEPVPFVKKPADLPGVFNHTPPPGVEADAEFIRDKLLLSCDPGQIPEGSELRFRNTMYCLGIKIERSTYRHTWTPNEEFSAYVYDRSDNPLGEGSAVSETSFEVEGQ